MLTVVVGVGPAERGNSLSSFAWENICENKSNCENTCENLFSEKPLAVR